jgi:DNA-binding NarL/FixJ family response regulator
MTARVRVVLAEDSYLVREGVRRLLQTDPDIELTSCCVDLEGLHAAVERDRPNLEARQQ